jgi:hypothetical protein
MKFYLLAFVVLLQSALSCAAEGTPRKYLCRSDSGVTRIRGPLRETFRPIEWMEKRATAYPWGVKLVLDAHELKITAVNPGDPDLPQPTGPKFHFKNQTDPGCVFRSLEGDSIPRSINAAVESCIVGADSGLIIHPWFLEGRPVYDEVPLSGGFSVVTYERVSPGIYDQFGESFGCIRLPMNQKTQGFSEKLRRIPSPAARPIAAQP